MNVKDYINNIPEFRKDRFLAIVDLVKSLYPDIKESMCYKMPTYKYQDGWIAIANQKNYISVNTCSPEHIAGFKRKFPGIKTGKGCINFRDSDKIPCNDLEPVIRSAIEYGKA